MLKVKAIEVEEKISTAEALSEKVGREKEICEREGKAAAIESESCEKIQTEVTQKQADCERDLAAALPDADNLVEELKASMAKDIMVKNSELRAQYDEMSVEELVEAALDFAI